MTRRYYSLAFTLAISASVLVAENVQSPMPMAVSIEPKFGTPGTVLTVKGNQLDKSRLDEVYLTDHRFDLMVKVLEQGGESMKIRIPPFAKPGRLQLLFLTSGDRPLYLEQPLYVEIRDPEEQATPAPAPVVVAAAAKPAPVVSAPVAAPLAAPRVVQAPTPALEEPKPQPVAVASSVNTVQPVPSATVVGEFAAPPPAPPVAIPQASTPAPAAANVPLPAEAPTAAVAAQRSPAKLIRRSALAYPELARSMKREGAVELLITIGADGTVREAKAMTGDSMLRAAAEESARGWKYQPARNGAAPVESVQNVTVNFKLR